LFALMIKEIPLRGRAPGAGQDKPAASEPELIS
jgi:hypothetical protein